MLIEKIKYTDYNGVEREESVYFNLSETELTEMQYGTTGGLTEMISKIIETQDMPNIMKIFKEVLLKSYGEKGADGRSFDKVDIDGRPLSIRFSQTEAFNQLYMKMARDPKYAAEFFKRILPSNLQDEVEKKNKEMEEKNKAENK